MTLSCRECTPECTAGSGVNSIDFVDAIGVASGLGVLAEIVQCRRVPGDGSGGAGARVGGGKEMGVSDSILGLCFGVCGPRCDDGARDTSPSLVVTHFGWEE